MSIRKITLVCSCCVNMSNPTVIMGCCLYNCYGKSRRLFGFSENEQLLFIEVRNRQLVVHISRCACVCVDANLVQHRSALHAHVCVMQRLSFAPTEEQATSTQRGRQAIWYECVITGNHNSSCSCVMWGEFNYLPLPVWEKSYWWEMDVLLQ